MAGQGGGWEDLSLVPEELSVITRMAPGQKVRWPQSKEQFLCMFLKKHLFVFMEAAPTINEAGHFQTEKRFALQLHERKEGQFACMIPQLVCM